jgi:hypothetical protein
MSKFEIKRHRYNRSGRNSYWARRAGETHWLRVTAVKFREMKAAGALDLTISVREN